MFGTSHDPTLAWLTDCKYLSSAIESGRDTLKKIHPVTSLAARAPAVVSLEQRSRVNPSSAYSMKLDISI